jgi:hypothetical protein
MEVDAITQCPQNMPYSILSNYYPAIHCRLLHYKSFFIRPDTSKREAFPLLW